MLIQITLMFNVCSLQFTLWDWRLITKNARHVIASASWATRLKTGTFSYRRARCVIQVLYGQLVLEIRRLPR